MSKKDSPVSEPLLALFGDDLKEITSLQQGLANLATLPEFDPEENSPPPVPGKRFEPGVIGFRSGRSRQPWPSPAAPTWSAISRWKSSSLWWKSSMTGTVRRSCCRTFPIRRINAAAGAKSSAESTPARTHPTVPGETMAPPFI